MFDAYLRIINWERDPFLPPPPAPPTGVTIVDSPQTTQMAYTISWDPVDGAGAYYIEHSAVAGGAYDFVTTTTGTSATVTRLSPIATEYVRIRAVNVVGGGLPADLTVSPGLP